MCVSRMVDRWANIVWWLHGQSRPCLDRQRMIACKTGEVRSKAKMTALGSMCATWRLRLAYRRIRIRVSDVVVLRCVHI